MKGAEFFDADQALILTGAAGAALPDDGERQLYVVRLKGDDYDLHKAGVDCERKVAVVLAGPELVTLIRRMIRMMCEAGEDSLIVADILADMARRQGKFN